MSWGTVILQYGADKPNWSSFAVWGDNAVVTKSQTAEALKTQMNGEI